MLQRRIWSTIAIAIGCAMFSQDVARAQSYPERPVTIVVPSAPGGSIDVTARLLAQYLSSELKQAVIVENRPGGSGAIGATTVQNAKPDGYTLLLGTSNTLSKLPVIAKSISFDPSKSFSPVASVSGSAAVLVVNPSVAANSCQEFVKQARDNPGQFQYSSSGVGSPPYFNAELLKMRANINIRHVPFRSTSDSINHVVDGTVEMTFQTMGLMLPHIRTGRLRALGVASPSQDSRLPNVPTMIECGYPGFIASDWTALLAPAGTPEPIVLKLNEAANASLKVPQFMAALAELNVEALGGAPQELASRIAADTATWASVARATQMKVE